jgi:hypothetical protein
VVDQPRSPARRAGAGSAPSTTCSPEANSRCANGRPTPFAPSTAQDRSGQDFAYARIAVKAARSVVNRPDPSSSSRWSTTSMAADSLWGSTPMMTCSPPPTRL